ASLRPCWFGGQTRDDSRKRGSGAALGNAASSVPRRESEGRTDQWPWPLAACFAARAASRAAFAASRAALRASLSLCDASLTAPPWLQFLPPTASDWATLETTAPWFFGVSVVSVSGGVVSPVVGAASQVGASSWVGASSVSWWVVPASAGAQAASGASASSASPDSDSSLPPVDVSIASVVVVPASV